MNIFFLHQNPQVAARMQARKSATKMILESAQLLSTAINLTSGCQQTELYKSAYPNHPSNCWTRRNKANFCWLLEHALELCLIYTEQTGKVHASQAVIWRAIDFINDLPAGQLSLASHDLAIKSTDAGLAALHRFNKSDKTFADAVAAYRWFYSAKSYVREALGKESAVNWITNYLAII